MGTQSDSSPPRRRLEGKQELANRHSVSKRTITNLMARGAIPYYRISPRLIRFDPVEVAEALARLRVSAVGEIPGTEGCRHDA